MKYFTHEFSPYLTEITDKSDDFHTAHKLAIKALAQVADKPHKRTAALFDSMNNPPLDELQRFVNERKGFNHIVVLGMGGATLSGQALTQLYVKRKGAEIHYMDDIDPFFMLDLIKQVPLQETLFLVISKSGGTLETLAQMTLAAQTIAKELGQDAIAKHMAVITENSDSRLKRIADEMGLATLNHPPFVGGRFAAFTAVGLVPALFSGLDIKTICQSAASYWQECLDNPEDALPTIAAALHLYLVAEGKTNTVFMPYINKLHGFTQLIRQIWAESLGKNGFGTTPVDGKGTNDQHSQLQLYLEGKEDKWFTFFLPLKDNAKDSFSTEWLNSNELDMLDGKFVGSIRRVSGRATYETICERNMPARVFGIDNLDEKLLGALLSHFMLETLVTAKLMQVNPYDQPAVESGKVRARDLLRKSS